MKENFEVIDIEKEIMILKSKREAGCHSCSVKNTCGTGILSSFNSNFRLPLKDKVKKGDIISLEMANAEIFFRAFQLYLMPLLSMFLFAYIAGIFFAEKEVYQIFFGFIAFFVNIVLLKFYLK